MLFNPHLDSDNPHLVRNQQLQQGDLDHQLLEPVRPQQQLLELPHLEPSQLQVVHSVLQHPPLLEHSVNRQSPLRQVSEEPPHLYPHLAM